MAKAKPKKAATKKRRHLTEARVFILATYNNTIVTLTDANGNALGWSSAGSLGFKGSRKSTPYAAQVAAEKMAELARDHGVKLLKVSVVGAGSGRESAIRAFTVFGIVIVEITDDTGIPHNGCRPKKRRRV
jgi:small subunit ribosomal protein S11